MKTDLVPHKNNEINSKLSDYKFQHLQLDYSTSSNFFPEVESTTFEQYFINQKIEKVKEILIYNYIDINRNCLST